MLVIRPLEPLRRWPALAAKAWARIKLLFWTLFYNQHFSADYAFETAMGPLTWAVDAAARAAGPLFVLVVVSANAGVVLVAYLVGLPFYWAKSK